MHLWPERCPHSACTGPDFNPPAPHMVSWASSGLTPSNNWALSGKPFLQWYTFTQQNSITIFQYVQLFLFLGMERGYTWLGSEAVPGSMPSGHSRWQRIGKHIMQGIGMGLPQAKYVLQPIELSLHPIPVLFFWGQGWEWFGPYLTALKGYCWLCSLRGFS